MADPICRWRNPYFKTIRELITVLPKDDLAKDNARQQTNSAFGSEDFFRTPYQLAAQLGLYYEDELILHTRFHNNPHPFEIIQYSDNWFKNYYVPNPYTARGFENIQPKILNVELSKLLFASKTELDWPVVKMELFGEEIGNDDILINVINTYSQLYQVKNNKLKLKDGIVYEDLQSCIYDYALPTRGDKKGFFEYIGGSSNDIDTEIVSSLKSENLISQFAKWLNLNPKSNYYENDFDKTVKGLEKIDEKYNEAFGSSVFEADFNNLEEFTKSVNDNIWNKESSFWTYSDATSTHLPRAILNENNYQRFLREFQQKNSRDSQPKNTIYFGPPGTGKSYAIIEYLKQQGIDSSHYSRITFHPDYDYSSFVGGYRPYTDDNDAGKIKYKFVPQVFTEMYVQAWRKPTEQFYLVIEEINRGNCAEIFGDIFQLLDRNPEYNIQPSAEMRNYLIDKEKEINEEGGTEVKLLFDGKLQMPGNLSILASMNTSDQSLFPMDSAFKRRWDWKYVPIDTDCKASDFTIEISKNHSYSWLAFLKNVNDRIYNVTRSADKQVGNWFIDATKTGNKINTEVFINKVLFYLWNDVFKDETHHPESIFRYKNGEKEVEISYNNFFEKTNQVQFLEYLFEKTLGLDNIAGKEEIIEEYIQPEADLRVAEPNTAAL